MQQVLGYIFRLLTVPQTKNANYSVKQLPSLPERLVHSGLGEGRQSAHLPEHIAEHFRQQFKASVSRQQAMLWRSQKSKPSSGITLYPYRTPHLGLLTFLAWPPTRPQSVLS